MIGYFTSDEYKKVKKVALLFKDLTFLIDRSAFFSIKPNAPFHITHSHLLLSFE